MWPQLVNIITLSLHDSTCVKDCEQTETAYQYACKPANLSLACIWTKEVLHDVDSYGVWHGDLSCFIHLAKAAGDRDVMCEWNTCLKRLCKRKAAYKIAVICLNGSFVATIVSVSSLSASA